MEHPTGESDDGPLRVDFDRRLKLQFHRSRITPDANSGIHEFMEAEGYKHAIRLPAKAVLQERIGFLPKRPVGRPPRDVRRSYAVFSCQAASWTTLRRARGGAGHLGNAALMLDMPDDGGFDTARYGRLPLLGKASAEAAVAD